jgi:hypothetical protein
MDMRATMANMDPGAMQQSMSEIQSRMAETMKKSLCGGSDTRKP